MLSQSVEMQEHLMAESPRELELDEEGRGGGGHKARGDADEELPIMSTQLARQEGSDDTDGAESKPDGNSNANNNRGEGVVPDEPVVGPDGGKAVRPEVLHLTVAAAESGGNGDSTSSEANPASVVNVGFDL